MTTFAHVKERAQGKHRKLSQWSTPGFQYFCLHFSVQVKCHNFPLNVQQIDLQKISIKCVEINICCVPPSRPYWSYFHVFTELGSALDCFGCTYTSAEGGEGSPNCTTKNFDRNTTDVVECDEGDMCFVSGIKILPLFVLSSNWRVVREFR